MQRTDCNLEKSEWINGFKFATFALFLTVCMSGRSLAQQHGQKTFSSPEEASSALVTAAQNNDEKAMLDILGRDGKQIVSSGDDAEDAQNRADFVKSYQEMHRLVNEPDGTTVLYIGAKNWPTPIPLMNKANSWFFDTDAGKEEILYRRVGKNEISTIHVCIELVAAQKEFFLVHSDFARKIISDEGQHNGLYWKAANGEPQSPIGPLVAAAVVNENAKSLDGAPTPYLGYYFIVISGRGKHGAGAANNNIVNGKKTEGYAFVAYPAEYKSSGVMTFMVDEQGVVYEKDLGTNTISIAKSIKGFNINSSWKKSDEQQEESATERINQ